MQPPELISVCQMFLVPVSILFGALGVAPTEQLKSLISLMGLLTSGIWIYRICVWPGLAPIDQYTTLALAVVFSLAWLVSLVAHLVLWQRDSKTPVEQLLSRR
jgi:hypothetical protein